MRRLLIAGLCGGWFCFLGWGYESPGWVSGKTFGGFRDENERMEVGGRLVPYAYAQVEGYWRVEPWSYRDRWGNTIVTQRRTWVAPRWVVTEWVPAPGGRAHGPVYPGWYGKR